VSLKLPGLQASFSTLGVAGAALPVRLFEDAAPAKPPPDTRRRRIWELNGSLHCSIIGTCLTTAELRQILIRARLPEADKDTDHQLHGRAVLLVAQPGLGSRLLQKALDRRHRAAIALFAKARTADDIDRQWSAAVERAEIAGAYWAALTHPEATEDLVRQVFGEVHMLSHLVGAANRADIRRLRALEAENGVLQETVARQQRQWRHAVAARDASIAQLREMLGKRLTAADPERPDGDDHRPQPAITLVADLRRQLQTERDGRERGGRRWHALKIAYQARTQELRRIEQEHQKLREELELAELALSDRLSGEAAVNGPGPKLTGMTLLYVGGRAHQIVQLRALAEQSGGSFLHHDGGIDDRSGLLAAQVARADVIFFPVDCVSHNAVATVKRVSRQVGNPYIALRSSGLTSFAAALRSACTGRQHPWMGTAPGTRAAETGSN